MSVAIPGVARRAGAVEAHGQSAPRLPEAVSGLVNVGNSCYMNSVLQALAAVDRLDEFAGRTVADAGADAVVAEAFLDVRNLINREAAWAHRPTSFIAAITRGRGSGLSREQQDAYEMYQAILDAMVSEAKPRPALALVACGLAAAATLLPRERLRQTAPRPSLPLLPLQGLLGSRIGCGVCGFRSSLKVVAFESVSLALPRMPTSRTAALDVLLHDHFRAEHINGYQCPRCSLLATRRTLVSSLPAASVIRTLANAAAAGHPPARSHTAAALARSEKVRSLQTLNDVQRVLDTGDYDALDGTELSRAVPRVVSPLVTKQVTVCRVPRTLCVHLNRLGYGYDGRQRKDACHVSYPSVLHVGPLCWPERAGAPEPRAWPSVSAPAAPHTHRSGVRPVLLHLVAVIVHLGDESWGHFVTYRKVARTKAASGGTGLSGAVAAALQAAEAQWVRISDDRVQPVDAETVFQSEAYMLFYSQLLL